MGKVGTELLGQETGTGEAVPVASGLQGRGAPAEQRGCRGPQGSGDPSGFPTPLPPVPPMTLNTQRGSKSPLRRRASTPLPRPGAPAATARSEPGHPQLGHSSSEPGGRAAAPRGSWSSESSGSSGCWEPQYRVVLLGDPGVGKTSLANAFAGVQERDLLEQHGGGCPTGLAGTLSCGVARHGAGRRWRGGGCAPCSEGAPCEARRSPVESGGASAGSRLPQGISAPTRLSRCLAEVAYERTLSVDGEETTLLVIDAWEPERRVRGAGVASPSWELCKSPLLGGLGGLWGMLCVYSCCFGGSALCKHLPGALLDASGALRAGQAQWAERSQGSPISSHKSKFLGSRDPR